MTTGRLHTMISQINRTISHASKTRSPRDTMTVGELPKPPRLEALYHTTAQVALPSIPAEPKLSTESSCTLTGPAVIRHHLTRRYLTTIDEDRSHTFSIRALLRGEQLEQIKQTSQCLTNINASQSTAKTGCDPSSFFLGIMVVALLAPVLRPLEFACG